MRISSSSTMKAGSRRSEADIELANASSSLKRFKSPDGKLYAVPMSLGACYSAIITRTSSRSLSMRSSSCWIHVSRAWFACRASLRETGLRILVVLGVRQRRAPRIDVETGFFFLKKLSKSGNVGRVAKLGRSTSPTRSTQGLGYTDLLEPRVVDRIKKNCTLEVLSKANSKTLKSYFYKDGFVIYKGPRSKRGDGSAELAAVARRERTLIRRPWPSSRHHERQSAGGSMPK